MNRTNNTNDDATRHHLKQVRQQAERLLSDQHRLILQTGGNAADIDVNQLCVSANPSFVTNECSESVIEESLLGKGFITRLARVLRTPFIDISARTLVIL